MLSEQPAGVIQFGRVPYVPGVLDSQNDIAAGSNAPHYEIIFGVRFWSLLDCVDAPLDASLGKSV